MTPTFTSLLLLNTFIGACIVFFRKNTFDLITIEYYMLLQSLFTLVSLFLYYQYDNTIFKNGKADNKYSLAIKLSILLMLGVQLLNYRFALDLLKKLDMSEYVSFKSIAYVIFTTVLGVVFLKEQLLPINALGIALGTLSIYLIQHQ